MPRLAKTLTDLVIRSATPPAPGKTKKLSGGRGLQLRVTKTAKLWEFSYRVGPQQQTLGLGQYPAVSLPEARRLRDALRAQLAEGLDPSTERRLAKASVRRNAVKGQSVEELADQWFAKVSPSMAPATRTRTQRTLAWINRLLGKRVAAEVTGPDIVTALRAPEAEGKVETARRMLQALSRILAFGVSSGAVARNVVADLNRRDLLQSVVATPHSAVTDPDEVGALIRGIRSYPSRATAICLLLMAYTAVRPREAREAAWSEIDLKHPGGAVWVIPKERTKQRREHEVPLSKQVVALLEELRPISMGSSYLFPGNSNDRKAISDTALRKVLRSLGYEASDHSLHGFRTTFSTLMNKMREAADVIEGAIGHKDGSVRSRYNRATLLKERKALFAKWANHLDQLARKGGKVRGTPQAAGSALKTKEQKARSAP